MRGHLQAVCPGKLSTKSEGRIHMPSSDDGTLTFINGENGKGNFSEWKNPVK